MAWQTHVLVLASRTADSDEFVRALRARAQRGGCAFTLLSPRETNEAGPRLERALARLREAGLPAAGARRRARGAGGEARRAEPARAARLGRRRFARPPLRLTRPPGAPLA